MGLFLVWDSVTVDCYGSRSDFLSPCCGLSRSASCITHNATQAPPAKISRKVSVSVLIFTLRHEEIKKPLRRIYRAGPSPPVNHVNVSTPSLQATNHQMRETFHHTSATLPAGLEWDFLARVLFNVTLWWWISFICLSALFVYQHFLMKTSSLHSLLIWTMAASKPNGWIPVQFRV